MMNTNPLSVPDDFKKNDVLDSDEFPMEDGSYKCPAPKQLVPLPDNVAGWSIEACCQHVGLCTDNDNINDNVACPSGQEIKRLYYEDSDELFPRSILDLFIAYKQSQGSGKPKRQKPPNFLLQGAC